jgi:hypothetical protein
LFPLLKGIDSLLFNDESIFDLNRVRSEGEAKSRGRKRLRRREKKKERELPAPYEHQISNFHKNNHLADGKEF